jgi:hypothetical protein
MTGGAALPHYPPPAPPPPPAQPLTQPTADQDILVVLAMPPAWLRGPTPSMPLEGGRRGC